MTTTTLKHTSIHGHTVYFDETTEKAMRYLKYDLDQKESKTHFEQAYHHSAGSEFEDEHERNFTLKFDNGKYTLEQR